jgi:hypothetical protein
MKVTRILGCFWVLNTLPYKNNLVESEDIVPGEISQSRNV